MATAVRAGISVGKFCKAQGLLSPADRLAFFSSEAALKVFPPQVCREQVKSLTREHHRVRNVACSATWADAALFHRTEYPPGGNRTGMELSNAWTQWGDAGTPCRRWTPAIAVKVEDALDQCREPRGAEENWPLAIRIANAMGSSSARAICVLRERRISPHNAGEIQGLADDRGRLGRRRMMQATKKAKENQ